MRGDTDRLRRWWDAHALTTDTVAGLLVPMITVLVVIRWSGSGRATASPAPWRSRSPS